MVVKRKYPSIKILPMCWKNPVTGKLALQVHPSAIQKLILKDGTVIDDLKEVREIVHRMQRPGISPELVYAVDWEEEVSSSRPSDTMPRPSERDFAGDIQMYG